MGIDRTLRSGIDVDAIKATIARAVVKRSALPPYEELRELHAELRGHIEALLPLAEKQVGELWRGSVEWYQKRSKLDTIPHLVGQGLGPGLRSASDHVRHLGRTCQFLLNNAGASEEEAG
ncbi:DUF6415 family natural product biosynthesis protein [Streptomyces sp. LX-29]|uniref:DUF6415 family natural product biosynthesis protein n=1 Tax=Streptomyces sp. LX-29 TaxID=2900152 RepID=UPI00240E770E|nr:DUF6415 family natural product biosynthesis protein [Streptomyces sp. LX-29]WFB08338.1 DUF6415 family natural product biosynthesis protein [Streptomyces sp. LX-29]